MSDKNPFKTMNAENIRRVYEHTAQKNVPLSLQIVECHNAPADVLIHIAKYAVHQANVELASAIIMNPAIPEPLTACLFEIADSRTRDSLCYQHRDLFEFSDESINRFITHVNPDIRKSIALANYLRVEQVEVLLGDTNEQVLANIFQHHEVDIFYYIRFLLHEGNFSHVSEELTRKIISAIYSDEIDIVLDFFDFANDNIHIEELITILSNTCSIKTPDYMVEDLIERLIDILFNKRKDELLGFMESTYHIEVGDLPNTWICKTLGLGTMYV